MFWTNVIFRDFPRRFRHRRASEPRRAVRHAGERLHEWMFPTRWWREMVGQPGGTDDAFARLHGPGVGEEIMGARKFGPPGWHDDPEWKGWWGPFCRIDPRHCGTAATSLGTRR